MSSCSSKQSKGSTYKVDDTHLTELVVYSMCSILLEDFCSRYMRFIGDDELKCHFKDTNIFVISIAQAVGTKKR